MREKDFYARISRHYTETAVRSMAIEVKITKTDSLPFSCLAMHQEYFLLQSERAFAHKIADVGMLKKPYDIMLVHHADAVLVVVFYRPRHSTIYEIDIRAWIRERECSKRRSLTEARAQVIGRLIQPL